MVTNSNLIKPIEILQICKCTEFSIFHQNEKKLTELNAIELKVNFDCSSENQPK